jgi:hypothetical protein
MVLLNGLKATSVALLATSAAAFIPASRPVGGEGHLQHGTSHRLDQTPRAYARILHTPDSAQLGLAGDINALTVHRGS